MIVLRDTQLFLLYSRHNFLIISNGHILHISIAMSYHELPASSLWLKIVISVFKSNRVRESISEHPEPIWKTFLKSSRTNSGTKLCINQGSNRETELVGYLYRFIKKNWLMQVWGSSSDIFKSVCKRIENN